MKMETSSLQIEFSKVWNRLHLKKKELFTRTNAFYFLKWISASYTAYLKRKLEIILYHLMLLRQKTSLNCQVETFYIWLHQQNYAPLGIVELPWPQVSLEMLNSPVSFLPFSIVWVVLQKY